MLAVPHTATVFAVSPFPDFRSNSDLGSTPPARGTKFRSGVLIFDSSSLQAACIDKCLSEQVFDLSVQAPELIRRPFLQVAVDLWIDSQYE